jgi:rhodanese-related sulfurtransferase
MTSPAQAWQFIHNHWSLVLALVVVMLLLIFEESKRKLMGTTRLTPKAAVDLINHETTLVVDLRDSKSFANGHIVDALNLAHEKLVKDFKPLEPHKDKVIILVAAVENQASGIANNLKKQNFSKVYVLADGIAAWKNANLPLVKS